MMNERLQELQEALQILALPVTFQMRLDVGGACRVRALSRPYVSWSRVGDRPKHLQLTHEQAGALSALDIVLGQLRSLPDCTDVTLRRYEEWQQVRRLARAALLAFGWGLNVPPLDAFVYEQVKNRAIHERFSQI